MLTKVTLEFDQRGLQNVLDGLDARGRELFALKCNIESQVQKQMEADNKSQEDTNARD